MKTVKAYPLSYACLLVFALASLPGRADTLDFRTFSILDPGAGGVSILASNWVHFEEAPPVSIAIYKDVFIPPGESKLTFDWTLYISNVGQPAGAAILDAVEVHVSPAGTIILPATHNAEWSRGVYGTAPSAV